MSPPFVPQFKLAGSGGDGCHSYISKDGAFIGRGVPLLERDATGRWRPRDAAVLERLLGAGYGAPFELGWRAARLRHVAESLNEGDLALAGISLLQMQLPPLPGKSRAQAMARADGLLDKYNPDWQDEPRVPAGTPDGGEWTGGDAGDGSASVQPAAARVDETQARKQRFADAHLADAQKVADRLGVPVENILGIAAVESTWGESRFAIQGNNLFGIHYPAPLATGYLPARRGPVRVATFANYGDSMRSFEQIAGPLIRDVSDPSDFAAALQNSGKFGINPVTGAKEPSYVPVVSATIRGLRPIVARGRT